MQSEVEDLLPLVVLLSPYEDLAVVTRRSDNVSVLGVSPGNTPNRTIVSTAASV